MRAERWQGAGNVYLLVEEAPADVAVLCRDHEADGVLVLTAVAGADVAMRIINPDGSEPEACGNGTRMVARFVAERDGLGAVRIDDPRRRAARPSSTPTAPSRRAWPTPG